MSKSAKIALVVVIAVVVGLGWWWMMGSQNSASPTTADNSGANQVAQQPAPAPAQNGQSIAQDLSSVDAQMNSFNSDSASINQGMSDQPVPQQQF